MLNNLNKIFTRMSSTKAGKVKKTLKDFGLAFNEEGQLRQLDENGEITNKPFNFQVSNSHSENQRNYEAVGEVITDEVYKLLDDFGMIKIYLPENIQESKAGFVFATKAKEDLKNVEKLMLIIHGSGVVRAGQWARSLIINHSINAGTILPYLRKAKDNGFEVIVTNTNDNLRDGKRIEGSGSPEEHAKTVWEQIKIINPASIAIVAHSYGGIVTSELARKYNEDFEKKVFAVAFTDSVHGSRGLTSRIIDIGINFVASSDKLGTEQHNYEGDIKRVSAGHSKHEWTSYSCIEALFEFLQEKYKIFNDLKDNSAANKKQKTEEL